MSDHVDAHTRSEILDLTIEHAYRLDHGMSDTLFELYAIDGEMLGLPPKDLIGKEAVRLWGVERVKLQRISRHVETNHRLVWKDGVLTGTVLATVYRSDTDDTTNTSPFMIGDYEDVYVQEDGQWKIRQRVIRRSFRVFTPPVAS